MNVLVDSVIRIPKAERSARLDAKIWTQLRFDNPEFQSRLRFGRDTEGVSPHIDLAACDETGALIVPRGAVSVVRAAAAECGEVVRFEDRRLLCTPIRYTLRATLRDYQVEAAEALVHHQQGCAVLPCGAGKSTLVLGAIALTGQPALIIVHTRDLVVQWRGLIRRELGIEPGIIAEGEVQLGDVTVATIQSLAQLDEVTLAAVAARFGCVVADECLPPDARLVVGGGEVVTARTLYERHISGATQSLLSFNHGEGAAQQKPVAKVSKKTVRRRLVTISVGLKQREPFRLRVTEEHPVFVDGRGYVPARDVQPGDRVVVVSTFYPCPHCERAFACSAGLGGHVAHVHASPARTPMWGGIGGTCGWCGRTFPSASSLHLHERLHADPDFAATLSAKRSARMRATNLSRQSLLSERMRSQNPSRDPLVKAKIEAALKARPKASYAFLDGGNGTPATLPERLLLDRLGADWVWQHVVATKVPRGSGYPTHYKIDLALAHRKIGIEVDGKSHKANRIREADERKDARLAELGWSVLRFRNAEVLADLERVLRRISEVSHG